MTLPQRAIDSFSFAGGAALHDLLPTAPLITEQDMRRVAQLMAGSAARVSATAQDLRVTLQVLGVVPSPEPAMIRDRITRDVRRNPNAGRSS